jgi:Tol biopolymer transport system component
MREEHMSTRFRCVVVMLLACLLSAPMLLSQGAPALFEQGLLKENAEGTLNEAIAIFGRIAGDKTADPAIRARAQLHVGICYEKLGDAQARGAYERLIADFPQQMSEVAAARARLAALKATLREAPSLATLRLVWKGPEIELMGAPSPDGRYICYTDWDTGDLAIHDLTTGQNRRLTGQKAWDGNFAENSRWSPDGRQIAYTWERSGDTPEVAEVRVVGLDGAPPRVLLHDKQYNWATVEDWSPDGRQILARLYPGTGTSEWLTSDLSLVSTSNGSVRQLRQMNRPSIPYYCYMKFSPDGKYIAFDYQNVSESSPDKDIVLLSVDGAVETPLVKHPADDYLLGWAPDGTSILFASDRTGAIDAWVQPVAAGQPAGEPRLVRKNVGAISPLGFARNGAFFYGQGTGLRNIYVATVDRTQEAMTATYRKLELPFEGRNDMAEFSPDGKRLAFVRASNRRADGTGGGVSNSICVRSLDTGEEVTFPLNLRAQSLRWSPGGSSILVNAYDLQNTCVRRVDLVSGNTRELFPTDKDIREEMHMSPDWSPDGRSVYCVVCRRTTGAFTCSIVVKDLPTDQTRVVQKETSGLPLISVSPDGSLLAAYELSVEEASKGGATRGTLKVISVKDGTERRIAEFVNGFNGLVMPRWSRDGRYVFFVGRQPNQDTWDIWYVPVEGGAPARLGLSLYGMRGIGPHPDGVQLAFSSVGPTAPSPEVWVMENLLPASKEPAAARQIKK